jgi:hypothetical protein
MAVTVGSALPAQVNAVHEEWKGRAPQVPRCAGRRPGPSGLHLIVDAQPTPPDYAEPDFSSKSVTWRGPSRAPRRACVAMTQPGRGESAQSVLGTHSLSSENLRTGEGPPDAAATRACNGEPLAQREAPSSAMYVT